jgi:hypothetical protein
MHYVVFVLPGGGLRGAIQAFALQQIEARLGKKIGDIADLLFCSSAGAVIGGSLAAGVESKVIAETLYSRASAYFPKTGILRALWRTVVKRATSIFDRDVILNDLKKNGADKALSELRCLYVACSVNMNTNLPRFFKSDEPGDSDRRLLDVIANSFAAPYYFGMRSDDKDQVTYSDPGTGVENNPVSAAFIEALSRKWHADENRVTIYVIGTGSTGITITPYEETKSKRIVKQALMVYMLGASQAEYVNMAQAKFLDSVFDNIDVKVYNPKLEPNEGGFANLDALERYKELGLALGDSIDLSPIERKINNE